jgi:hypothetical protein
MLLVFQQRSAISGNRMLITGLVYALLLGLSIDGRAQKKSPYADYWEQEEKRTHFEAHKSAALNFFRASLLDSAIARYNEALKIFPDDQEVKARLRDIQLLKVRKEAEKLGQIPSLSTPVTDTNTPLETAPNATAIPEDSTRTSNKDTITYIPLAQPKDTIPPPPAISTKKQAAPATTITEPERPFKNSENYKKYLATIYKSGWTEEKYKEGTREIVKRVFVEGDKGDEYQQVRHQYGAVFYFKNGVSISKATWVAETGKD